MAQLHIESVNGNLSGPSQLDSGIYHWQVKYNLWPIPILSDIVAEIEAGLTNDQSVLSDVLTKSGYTGTATIISKNVSIHSPFPLSVDSVTIDYTIAFTSPPLAALIPFLPAIAGIISTIIIGLVIVSSESFLEKLFTKPEYTPIRPGECASGYVYDAKANICRPTPTNTVQTIGIVLALAVAGGVGIYVYDKLESRKK